MKNKNFNIFFEKLEYIIDNKKLIKLILSNKKNKSSELKNVTVTLVELKKGTRLNFVYRHNTKDITKNYEIEEGLRLVKKAMDEDFFNSEIYSNTENINLISNSKSQSKLKIKEATLQPLTTFNHDRIKNRLINTKNNIYLRELGITNAKWQIRHEMIDKYKQINRYIELLSPNLKEFKLAENFHIVDMGAGKGYLTFALYDYLTNNQKKKIRMTGVEFRENLVKKDNEIAKKSNFDNLKFIEGTIEKTEIDNIDILIALHACDTATDEAIFRGIKSEASLIVCAPCCHKQIRKEFNVTNELSSVVKHGILKERQAEIITDALRALIMETYGYKTKIFEFISTEHTPKNLMIVGRKVATKNKDNKPVLENIAAIKRIYGIKQHYLEKLLGI